jgi:DNA-binding protein Fis
MKPFIYLPDYQKEPYKQRIISFVDMYKKRLAVQFDNLDEEAEQAVERYYEELDGYFDPDRHDQADISEKARDFSIDYWQTLNLMKYNTYMMTLATLYQIWEQLLRELSFREITRHNKLVDCKGKVLEFKDFCVTYGEIKSLFSISDWPPESITSWDTINELRMVQNVIKHGDGLAADQLKQIQPDYFQDVSGTLIMDLYGSTLNEIALSIPETAIDRYLEALIEFWEEMPERVYFAIGTAPIRVKGPITLQNEANTGSCAHYVQNQRLTPGCTIQVRFQKKKWISGTYQWTGNPADQPELHSKNSSDVLIFRLNHQITLEVEDLVSQS